MGNALRRRRQKERRGGGGAAPQAPARARFPDLLRAATGALGYKNSLFSVLTHELNAQQGAREKRVVGKLALHAATRLEFSSLLGLCFGSPQSGVTTTHTLIPTRTTQYIPNYLIILKRRNYLLGLPGRENTHTKLQSTQRWRGAPSPSWPCSR